MVQVDARTDAALRSGELALSLTVGLSVPQVVRGELERLQPDVQWRHPEPARTVHAAVTLQIGVGLRQPVSAACALQPAGLPASELPTRVERWALGGGNGAGPAYGGGGAPPRQRGAGVLPGLAGADALFPCSALEPAGRGGGRGPWPVRAPTPRPGHSCCLTLSAPRSPSPGLRRPVCSGAATSTRSCSGLCPPGPR